MARGKRVAGRATQDVKDAARKYTLPALETLATIMETSGSDPARIAAARELLDRAHGKATVDVAGSVGTFEELVERTAAARLAAEKGTGT